MKEKEVEREESKQKRSKKKRKKERKKKEEKKECTERGEKVLLIRLQWVTVKTENK